MKKDERIQGHSVPSTEGELARDPWRLSVPDAHDVSRKLVVCGSYFRILGLSGLACVADRLKAYATLPVESRNIAGF